MANLTDAEQREVWAKIKALSAQANNYMTNALHGRKDAHNAAIGKQLSELDGYERCPDCGIRRFPRNRYQSACYCGHSWGDPYTPAPNGAAAPHPTVTGEKEGGRQ